MKLQYSEYKRELPDVLGTDHVTTESNCRALLIILSEVFVLKNFQF